MTSAGAAPLNRAFRALVLAGFVLTLATCRDGMEPQVHLAPIAVAPVLPSGAALASFGLAIDRVRFVVLRPAAATRDAPPDTLVDTTVALPPDSATLELDLRVPLIAGAETLQVTIVVLSGTIPLFEGTASVVVTSGAAPTTPTEIPVQTYIGPGAGVDSIAISPALPFLFFNDSLRFQVEAFQAGVLVTQFYVSWSTSDTNLARVNGAGLLRAPASRTSVWVIARTPGGAAVDSTLATFVPLPNQLLIIGGSGQTGATGQSLATQLEVEVRAADNLPVPGVDVRFRSLSGGSPADTIVTSDPQGRARVTGVLGATPGPQTFQASLPAFPGVAFAAFNATATGIVISPAMSIVTVASGSVVSGNTVKLRLQGKDASGADMTTGGALVVFTRSGGSSTGSISATADSGNGVYTAVFTGALAGSATTIGATIGGAPVTTTLPTIAVSPGAISTSGSVVTVSNGTVASGSAVTLRLQSRDAAGNDVATGGSVVVFSAAGGTSTGNIGVTADSGNGVYTAPFTGVLAGTGTTIGATIDGSPVTSPKPSISVTPGTPAQLTFTGAPNVAATGVVIAPAVQVAAHDLAGNATPAYAGDVTIAIGTNPGGGSLAGTLTRTASSGVATFNDLAIDLPGIGYTLRATAAAMGSDTTASFDVVPPSGTIFWANAAGGTWSNPANWSGGAVPSTIETAAITLPGTYTVTLDVGDTIAGLQLGATSGTQTLLAASKLLHVSGTTQVNPNGVLDFRASTLNGGTFSNGGTLLAVGGSTINPAVVTTAASLIRAQGNNVYGAANLTVSGTFTNNGTIVLTDTISSYGATLSMPAGATLTNDLGGTITAAVGANGIRTLALALDNRGTVTLDRGLTLNRAGAVHSNSGTINVSGGDLTVTQSGTSPSFTTTAGFMLIGSGHSLLLSGGSFNFAGGTISGAGTLSLTSTTATITPTLTTSFVGLALTNSTVGGTGTLVVASGTALDIKASTITASILNSGLLTVHGSTALTWLQTNEPGATLRVQGDNVYGAANLTIGTGFTSAGTIVLTDTISSYGATLTMPAGATLTNGTGATIDAAVGFGGNRTLALALDNRGTMSLNRALTISRASAAHTNSGTIDVSGGDFTLNQSGVTPSFATSGSISIAPGRSFTVNGGAFDYTAGSISGGGTFALSTATVTAAQNFSTATAELSIASSTWGGTGTLTVASGTSLLVRASTINSALVNQGLLVVNGASAFNGAVTNPAGTTLRVQGNNVYGVGSLSIATAFTNSGTIELTDTISSYGAVLAVSLSQPFVNAPGGTIAALQGFNGYRFIHGQLDNQGTVSVATAPNQPLTFASGGVSHQNSGNIVITSGNLLISGPGESFTNTGAISVGAGDTLRMTNGSFTHNGGTLGGAGALSLESVTSGAFNAAQSIASMLLTSSTVSFATPQSTGTTGFTFSSSTINGPGLITNEVGQTLLVRGSVVNAPVDNQGTLLVHGSSQFNGGLTTAAGSLVRVKGDNISSSGTMTALNGFTNNGTIELTDTVSTYGAFLNVTNGTLVNAPAGQILAVLGASGSRALSAQLDNQGLLSVAMVNNGTFTLGRSGAVHQNSGTFDISGGDVTMTQSAGGSFTNTGTITVAAGDTLSMNNGSLTHNAGTFGGAGMLVLSGLNSAAFNTAHSFAAMRVNSSTVAFATPQTTAATDFDFLGSTIDGPAPITNEVGRTLPLHSTVVRTALRNVGTILTTGATSFTTDTLTTVAGSLIRIQGDGTFGSSALTVTKGFENSGTIELTDIGSTYGASLTVPNGKLVNLPGGFVNALAGANGARTLTAELDNRGTVAVALAPNRDLAINKSGAVHVNSGTIDVTGGGIAMNAAASFQNIGAINLGAGDTLSITNGAFSYDAGTLGTGTLVLNSVNPANFNRAHTLSSIVLNNTIANFAPAQTTASTSFALTNSVFGGTGTLTNAPGKTIRMRASGIAAPFVNQGTVIATGSSSLDALTTVAGSTLHVEGDGTSGLAALTVTGGLVNNGTIELTDVGSSYGATLVVKTLPLLNAGTIDIQPGANGGRTIDATIDNQGTFTVNQGVTISPPTGVAHTNRGTYKVKAGAITFSQPGGNPSFTNQAGGIIDIDAGTVFRVTNGPVTNALSGKILGFGTLDVRPPATFTNDGEIIPGASPGKLTIAGNALISASGIITVELEGPTAGTEYDQLVITGAANFAEGTLNVSLLPTLPDPKGLSFDVVTFGPGSTTGPIRTANLPPQCVGGQVVTTATSLRVICP